MQQSQGTLLSQEYEASSVAREIAEIADDKKANDVTVIEVGKVTTLADFFVIATGTSDRQIGAISSGIQERMKEQGIRLLQSEGVPSDGWILLDFGQVIVHVFAPEQRAYYNLERRWEEAPTVLRIQ